MYVVHVQLYAEAKKVFSSITLHIIIITIIITETGSPLEPEAHCCLGWPPSSQDSPLSAPCTEVAGMYGHAWLFHGCWGFEPRSSCFYNKHYYPWRYLPKPLGLLFMGQIPLLSVFCFTSFSLCSFSSFLTRLPQDPSLNNPSRFWAFMELSKIVTNLWSRKLNKTTLHGTLKVANAIQEKKHVRSS